MTESMRSLQLLGGHGCRYRTCEQITLCRVATDGFEKFCLRLRFHAFSNDAHRQVMR